MRIDLKQPTAYPWYLRPFFWSQRRKYGAVLDSALAWARAPRLFLGVAMLYGMIDRRSSPIEPALRSLVTVRVSQINWCRFCVDLNTATLLQRGVSRAKVEALEQWRECELFDERDRAVLDYAEAMTFSEREVEEVTMTRLKDYFDDDAIVELTGLIAFQNMSSKMKPTPPQGTGYLGLPPFARRER
ncbi:MAG: carboxymuconolactone decarboxylase family protein, partial [Alphaproteobacteria bacterium]|nr:carboxymuconolactone decarboxylase family protein [Alphaproteobacteria bacterium]